MALTYAFIDERGAVYVRLGDLQVPAHRVKFLIRRQQLVARGRVR